MLRAPNCKESNPDNRSNRQRLARAWLTRISGIHPEEFGKVSRNPDLEEADGQSGAWKRLFTSESSSQTAVLEDFLESGKEFPVLDLFRADQELFAELVGQCIRWVVFVDLSLNAEDQ